MLVENYNSVKNRIMKVYTRIINNSKKFIRLNTVIAVSVLSLCLSACKSDNPKNLTTLKIEDPYRKYFPIVQGQKLKITIKVQNTGEEPLLITHVLPSCGCTTAKFPKVIGAKDYGIIQMEYNSIKNIGQVGFHTTILANTKEKSHTFFFETNVVPDALYTKDYEELYEAQKENIKGSVEEMVDGAANQKGYIVDSTEKRKFR